MRLQGRFRRGGLHGASTQPWFLSFCDFRDVTFDRISPSPSILRRHTSQIRTISTMSFNRLSQLEAQPPEYRDDPETRDDQEFNSFAENLSVQLFSLTSSISRLSQQINLLGTKRDTERVRERVSDLLEETRDGFKDVGDKMRRLAAWEDVNVRCSYPS